MAQAAEDGSRRELLVALRSRVAKAVEDEQTPPRDLAALNRRLQEIAKEIDAIDAAESGDNSVVADTQDEAWDDSSI
ncbi:hypothetical protein GS528_16880 [Rhodococcus hoagii]|nr:hypothetical protein [Prescottella equi]